VGELWNRIKDEACLKTGNDVELPTDGRDVYLTQKSFDVAPPVNEKAESAWWDKHWVIGPYKALTDLAVSLKSDEALRDDFTDIGAAYGRRHGDVPRDQNPTAPIRFAKAMKRAMRAWLTGQSPKGWHDPYSRDMKAKKLPRSGDDPEAVWKGLTGRNESQESRRTDRFDACREFYKSKTLEAHHIVEKSILGILGLNHGDLDDKAAPCVLVAAELHQQFFTPEVRDYRARFTAPPSDPAKRKEHYVAAADELERIYNNLYKPRAFEPLQDIANEIIKHVRQAE
jgi:hypothetical protein